MAHLSKLVPSRTGDDMKTEVRHDFGIYTDTHGTGRISKADIKVDRIMVSFVVHFFNVQGIVWGEWGRMT